MTSGSARSVSESRTAHGAMLLYAALISASFSIGDRVTPFLAPRVLTTERFAIGAAAFALVALARRELRLPTLREVPGYALLAGSMVGFFLLMFAALRRTDAVSTGALFTLLPLLTAVVARVLVGQRTRPSQWALMAVGALGASFVVFDGSLARALRLELGPGEGLFLLGLCSFSLYSPLVRRLHRGDSALFMTLWTLIAGVVLLVPLSASAIARTDWSRVPLGVHAGVAWLGLVNTAGTFLLAQFASTRLPSAKVMGYTFLTPVFVVLLEGLLGQGWPTPPLWAGLLITASATGAFAASRSDGAAAGRRPG